MDEQLDLEQIRADYLKALRAWHVAWYARDEWHRERFSPAAEREHSVLYDHVIEERAELRDAEDRAWDRVLRARGMLAEALRSES